MCKSPATAKRGFHPPIPQDPGLWRLSYAVMRMDGGLDRARLHPRLHVSLDMTRLGNIVSSFQIEGVPLTRQQATDAIRDGSAMTPAQQDARAFADRYVQLHEGDVPRLTPEGIREWHGSLFSPGSLDHGRPGEWKTEENGVWDNRKQEWVFTATPPDETVPELERLLAWLDGDGQRLPPPMAAAIFFAEFQAIHPFGDGNGRLGRLLNLAVLKQRGLLNAFLCPIDEEFLRNREAYYNALRTTNKGESYTAWCWLYLPLLERAYGTALRRESLDVAFDAWRPSARRLLEWVLRSKPEAWFKRGDYPNDEGFSDATLTQALAELAGAGVLEPRGEKKGREYRLVWSALERLLGER